MKIETVAEHLVDTDLLKIYPNVLDLGCRGFIFTNELRRLGYSVYSVDCDYYLEGDYLRLAVSDRNGTAYVVRDNDPQATKIVFDKDAENVKHAIPCMTLRNLMTMLGHYRFGLIKMDIEGSELEVIMSLTEAPARQLSVEFHRHTGAYGDGEIEQMVDKLKSLGYEVVSHEKTSQHGLPPNYWSSLFILP